jgi:hypothetical protein
MKRAYHRSCHCGAVRFECELDLAQGTSRCNCSICAKSRFWKAIAAGKFGPRQAEISSKRPWSRRSRHTIAAMPWRS